MGARPQFEERSSGEGLWAWLRVSPRGSDREPAVSRAEIAAWYAQQLAPQVRACLDGIGRPGILFVRCPELSFHGDLREALSEVLLQGPACEVLWNLPTESEALREVAHETVNAVNAGRTRVFVGTHEHTLSGVLPVVDAVLRVPRFDPATLSRACQSFYTLSDPPSVPPEPWVRQVGPLDLLVSSEARGDAIAAIRATVLHRLRAHDCSEAMPPESLLGLNEVRTWAMALIDDIRDAIDPEIRCGWADVERAVVFAGPRGVGRASLARAIARATGLHWMCVSARRWTEALESERFQSHGERQASLCAMEHDFEAARGIAPAILFIEDLGSLHPDLAFDLGQQIAAHDAGAPLLVIGGCTDEDLPPDDLLRRALFEHTVYLPLPSAQVLALKLGERLQTIPHRLTEAQCLQVGRLALGGTAQDLDLYIRRAQKIARREGSDPLGFDDLARAILETPDLHARPKISDRDLVETAYHESGHAVVQFLEIAGGQQLQFVTIVPRRRGGRRTLGFVLRQPEEDRVSLSRSEGLAQIRGLLAGLAAEELLRGRENRTAGASNDLQVATRLAAHLVGRCGLGDRGSLVSRTTAVEADPQLAREVDRLLRRQYRQTLGLLRRNWDLVDALARRLLVQQELSGDEARALMHEALAQRSSNPAPADG